MKKWTVVGVALAVALTACAASVTRIIYTEEQPRIRGYSSAHVTAPNPTAPNIFVVGNRIVVDQEPIRPPGNQQDDPVTIYFGLEEDGGYTFPEDGVVIRDHRDYCRRASAYVFKCSYRRPAPGTKFKYTIHLKSTTGTPPDDLDPTIWN